MKSKARHITRYFRIRYLLQNGIKPVKYKTVTNFAETPIPQNTQKIGVERNVKTIHS